MRLKVTINKEILILTNLVVIIRVVLRRLTKDAIHLPHIRAAENDLPTCFKMGHLMNSVKTSCWSLKIVPVDANFIWLLMNNRTKKQTDISLPNPKGAGVKLTNVCMANVERHNIYFKNSSDIKANRTFGSKN